MPTITLRVDDQTKDDLDALARSRGTTITDLLRPLVDELTGRATERPGAYPVHLSPVERRILSLQHEILGKLDPDLEQHQRLRSEALDAGYAAEYAEEFAGVEPGLTARDCELVQDILDMFRNLINSFNVLKDKQGLTKEDVRFKGFDGNNETKRWAFAEYLQKSGRWQETLVGDPNSHSMHTMSLYPEMLDRYEPIKQKVIKSHLGNWQLTAEQIKTIIGKKE